MSEVKDIKSFLVNKKVKVVPVKRRTEYMGQTSHDGSFLFTGAVVGLSLPRDKHTGQLKKILNKEEQAFFEDYMNKKPGELSFYEKNSKFWGEEMYVKMEKDGLELDLSNPVDNLKWRIIKANTHCVAPSWAEKGDDAAYKWVIEEEDVKVVENLKKSDRRKEAYISYGKIQDSISTLKNILRLAGKTGIPANADINFLQSEVSTIIDENIDQYLEIIRDTKFDNKIFIQDALDAKAIEKDGRTAYKFKGAGERFADTLEDALEFFERPENGDLYLKVKAQIKNKK